MEILYVTLKSVLEKIAGRTRSSHKPIEAAPTKKRSVALKATGMRTRRRVDLTETVTPFVLSKNPTVKLEIQDGLCRVGKTFRRLTEPVPIHFWGHHVTWEGVVDEIVCLDNRAEVFSEWWENVLERVYYRLDTKAGRQLWLYRSAEGDYLQGLFE